MKNWFVLKGSVDYVENNFKNLLPVDGLYIDLDATTGMAGKLESREIFSLQPGEYMLLFDLGRSQVGLGETDKDTDTVLVSVGNLYEEDLPLHGTIL